MDGIAAVSLGDAAIAALALLMAVYEAWLATRRDRRAAHAWISVTSFAAAVYALAMLVHYNTSRPELAVLLSKIETVCFIAMSHAAPFVAMAIARRRMRVPWQGFAASAAFWLAMLATPWLISNEVEPRDFAFLAHPFLRRVETPLAIVGQAWALALVAGSAVWLRRQLGRRSAEASGLFRGLAMWVVLGLVDAAFGLLGDRMPMSLLEYGFFLFALSMVTSDAGKYMSMLAASERDFRGLIERAPESVAILREGTLTFVNEAMLAALGRGSAGELLGQELESLVQPEDAESLRELLASSGPRDPRTLRFARADGEAALLEVVAMRTELDGGPAVVVLARDVTSRHAITARMMEMDRMVSVGTLAAGVGHEINNPLSYVLLNLHEAARLLRAKEDEPDVAQAKKRIESGIDGAERIAETVRALAFFSRQQDTERPTILEPLIHSAVAIANNEIKHRARLELELEPGLVVRANETRLGQVFVNLLINAAHAIERGSFEDNLVRVTARRDGESIVCEVSDTGVGIEAADLERIFEPFYTTKPPGQGTGLGLGICRATVRELGGELTVRSVRGEGSVFVVTLPAAQSAAPTERARRSTIPPVRRGRLLVVDDEPELLRALCRTLGRYAEVVGASSSEDALAVIEREEPFDLILSDLMMPNGSGMDLYDALRRIDPAASRRMVFMTGGAFTPEARAFRDRIDNEVLEKPVDIGRVREHLERALEISPS